MSWLLTIVSFLFKPQESTPFLVTQILGYIFIIVGGAVGIFFLFQFLVPLIGYLESGAVLSLLLMGGGVLMLFLSPKKQSRPIDPMIGEVQEIFRKTNIQTMLKENGPKIIIFSFITGIILSQLKGQKSFSDLKNLCKWDSWFK